MLWAGCSVAGSGSGDPLPSELGTVNWTQPARPLPGTSEFGSALNEVNCTASKASLVSGPRRECNFHLRQRQRFRAPDPMGDPRSERSMHALPVARCPVASSPPAAYRAAIAQPQHFSSQLPTPPCRCLLKKGHRISNVMLPLGLWACTLSIKRS